MYLIGLDFGTTNIKGLLLDENGRILRQASRPTPTRFMPDGQAEFLPDELFAEMMTVLGRLASDFPHKKDIRALSFASMAESGVPLDRDMRPLAPAIAWFDQRTVPVAREIENRLDPLEIYRITGMQVSHLASLCKILWEKKNRPEVHRKTHRWVLVCNYLTFRLTGECRTDPSQACRTMVFDIRNGAWSEEMCRLNGIEPDIFPPVMETGRPLGTLLPEIAAELGLDRSLIVVQGGHDHPCGALSTGLNAQGTLCNSSGTVDNALTLIDGDLVDRTLFDMGLSCGRFLLPDTFYTTGGLLSAGRAVEWFAQNFYQETDSDGARAYQTMMAEADQAAAGSRGVLFVPHLRGSIVPHKTPYARGVFLGLRDIHQRAELARALFEGLSLEFRLVIERLEKALDRHFGEIRCFGGGSQNRVWLQIKADVWNRPLKVYRTKENTGLGAAILAGMGSGLYTDSNEAQEHIHHEVEVVEPNQDRTGLYDALYREVYVPVFQHKREIDALMEKYQGA